MRRKKMCFHIAISMLVASKHFYRDDAFSMKI